MAKRQKKQYYVVAKGHKPGIYATWFGADGAAEQVQGIPKAIYKGFHTRDEAAAWIKEVGADELLEQLELRPDPPQDVKGATRKVTPEEQSALLAAGKVVIFTDGAALGNPGPGGYGAVLLYQAHRKELSAGYRLTTNNRMELMACIAALAALKQPCSVVIYSDSKYVVDAVVKGWAERWRAKGWFRNKQDKAENVDLWQQLLDLCAQHDEVTFHWVKGHAGQAENERCDQLAVAAAAQAELPADAAYEAGATQAPTKTLFDL